MCIYVCLSVSLFFFFFFFNLAFGSALLVDIRGSVCILKYQRIQCVLFPRMNFDFCIYHLVVWLNFNFWLNFFYLVVPSLVLILSLFYSNYLCDYSFRHHIIYTFYSFVYYRFLLFYNSLLWRCFVLLLEKILFLSSCFLFVAMSWSSCVKFCQFVT